MKLLKPYVNLVKSASNGVYTLNSVVSVPKGYALNSLNQGEIERDGKKLWAVTATITSNGSIETEIAEFSVPLDQGPTDEIKTVSMVMVNNSMMSGPSNPEQDNHTDVDYDDAGGATP
ncbi:hypothetical protein [Marinifilum caeruleilacunae]|uniref:Phage protein n=1 Tax=Marinifilum caeruleilacunae TaxID=2499076 RepID=A0ABX1WRI9_9BACT|nr:hypothetical protein [Marinifilum caeruleilacunae]NOU58580.1 hypothetical protein [Marinifilum caeruleilacunae]